MSAAGEQAIRALVAADQLEEADAQLRTLLGGGSGPIVLWRLWVHVLRQLGRPQEALPIQRMIVDTMPADMTARFVLSEILLILGAFEPGWRAYRFRYDMPHTSGIQRKVQKPRWSGEALTGRTLLVHDEQGYGDTLQFMRLLPLAKQRSQARVVFDVNRATFSLAQRSLTQIDAVIPSGALPPDFDMHCELMSLPMALGLTLADLPGRLPYLAPDPVRLTQWQARLAGLPRPLVALAWAGRPTHVNDANRSMTLEMLGGLATAGVHFVSIQKGPAATQMETPPAGMALTSLGAEIEDFDDTAAILSLVDVLVSVDSSPVHLAGGLGRPAWVMLPFAPDWRWLTQRADTPWYPQHRLFRQPARHRWEPVIGAIASALASLREGIGLGADPGGDFGWKAQPCKTGSMQSCGVDYAANATASSPFAGRKPE